MMSVAYIWYTAHVLPWRNSSHIFCFAWSFHAGVSEFTNLVVSGAEYIKLTRVTHSITTQCGFADHAPYCRLTTASVIIFRPVSFSRWDSYITYDITLQTLLLMCIPQLKVISETGLLRTTGIFSHFGAYTFVSSQLYIMHTRLYK